MLYLVLITLAFSHIAEAATEPSTDGPVTQIAPRGPSSPLAYQRSLLDKINYLQRQNDELTKSLQDLQIYRDWIIILENRSTELQKQIRQGQAHFQQLDQERADVAAKLQKYQVLIAQTREERALFQKQQALDRKQIQESQNNANTLKEKLQSTQAALEDSEQQLQKKQETIAQLQQEQQTKNEQVEKALQLKDQNTKVYTEQVSILNEQLQSKTKKNNDLYDEIYALNLRFTAMNKEKIISEQELKRVEASEASCQKSLKASVEKETQNEVDQKEAAAAIAKWSKDYDQLKSQLDVALSIITDLREQNAQLENKSKKNQ